MITTDADAAPGQITGWSATFRGVGECIRDWWILIWTSDIGLLIGIVLGAGASIASFVAYGQARMFSKEPNRFGDGHPPGLIAAETSNNGVTSGTMVPLLGWRARRNHRRGPAVVLQYNGVSSRGSSASPRFPA